ncbi:MAG: hypothetical protein WBC44_04400 [Planctomycetaceae bacterium]
MQTQLGEPAWIRDIRDDDPQAAEYYWYYRHGLLGETQITFEEGNVVGVSSRTGK